MMKTTTGIKNFFHRYSYWLGVFALVMALAYTNTIETTKPQPIIFQERETITPFIPMEIEIPVHLKFSKDGGGFKMLSISHTRVTAYNNLPAQTNNQPNVGASNRKVFVGSCAVSRDILRDYKVKYGDILCIQKNRQCYFIEDTMNKRYDGENGKHVDIFMYDLEEAKRVNFVSDIVILQQL